MPNNNNNEIKRLTLEELTHNLKVNVKTLCDREPLGYRKLADAIRVNEMVIRNIANGVYINPNAYIVYRIADYFNYEMDEICLPRNEFERLGVKPTSFQVPLTAEQFEANYGGNSIILAEQKKIITKDLVRGLEIELTSSKKLNKIAIFEAHQISNRLDTKMHSLLQNIPQRVIPVENNLKKQFRFTELSEKITYLAQKNSITLEKLAIDAGFPPSQLIIFTATKGNLPRTSISTMQILFNISNLFEDCTIDLLLDGTEEELSHLKLKPINNAKEISVPMMENYKNNLLQHLERYWITEYDLVNRYGCSLADILRGRDVFIAQEIVNSVGQTLHSWLTYTFEHLPAPDSKLSTKIIKNMSKVLIITAGISLGAVFKSLPVIAAEKISEDIIINNRKPSNLIRPCFSKDHPVNTPGHPLNIYAQLIDVTTQFIAAHVLLAFKTIFVGLIQGIDTNLRREMNSILQEKGFIEHILSPLYLPWDIAMGAVQAYMNNVEPAVQKEEEWMNTVIDLITTSARNIYESVKTALGEGKETNHAFTVTSTVKKIMNELAQKTMRSQKERHQSTDYSNNRNPDPYLKDVFDDLDTELTDEAKSKEPLIKKEPDVNDKYSQSTSEEINSDDNNLIPKPIYDVNRSKKFDNYLQGLIDDGEIDINDEIWFEDDDILDFPSEIIEQQNPQESETTVNNNSSQLVAEQQLQKDIAAFENMEKELTELIQQFNIEKNKYNNVCQSHIQKVQKNENEMQQAVAAYNANIPNRKKWIQYELRKCQSSYKAKYREFFQREVNQFNMVKIPSICAANGFTFPPNYTFPPPTACNLLRNRIISLGEKQNSLR